MCLQFGETCSNSLINWVSEVFGNWSKLINANYESSKEYNNYITQVNELAGAYKMCE